MHQFESISTENNLNNNWEVFKKLTRQESANSKAENLAENSYIW